MLGLVSYLPGDSDKAAHDKLLKYMYVPLRLEISRRDIPLETYPSLGAFLNEAHDFLYASCIQAVAMTNWHVNDIDTSLRILQYERVFRARVCLASNVFECLTVLLDV